MTTFESIIHHIYPEKNNLLLRTKSELPDPIDIYLREQDCYNQNGFMKIILKAFDADPRMIEKYESPVKLLLLLLNQYGRFWMDDKEVLWYRDSQVHDHKVEQLIMGPTPIGNHCIARVNGKAIPTICLGQLKQLLLSKGEKWQSLIDKIDLRRTEIEICIEGLRVV